MMDILKILNESKNSIYPEDLDFFETELATGEGYSPAYVTECLGKIAQLRNWMNGGGQAETPEASPKPAEKKPKLSIGPVVSLSDLAPKEANSAAASISLAQIIMKDIDMLRTSGSYKTDFRKYVAGKAEIDADFVDKHLSFFKPWELDAIISVKQMPEEFIEKYFGVLDHAKIARYQQFSESFFIKHFSQLDTEIVLRYGKNPWRKKENRSKQLDVFLRIKGVTI